MLVSVGSKHFNYLLDTYPFWSSWINLTYYSSVFLDNMAKNGFQIESKKYSEFS